MKKKIIGLIFISAVFVTYFILNSKYFDSVTKIRSIEKINMDDIISNYAKEFIVLIKLDNEEKAFQKLYNSKFSTSKELKEYFFDGILVKGSLMDIQEINSIGKDEYKVKMRIYPPLFTDNETIAKNKAYQEKDIEIGIKLDGIFNYYVSIN